MEQGEWYYTLGGGEEFGPVTIDELQSMLREGKLRGDDLAWHEGLAEWTALRDIPEITGQVQTALPSDAVPAIPDGPRGLGGWLILPAIGLLFFGLCFIILLAEASRPTAHVLRENWLGTGRAKPAAFILGVDAFILFFLAFSIYVSVLFFRRKRLFPTICIISLWVNAAGMLGELAFTFATSRSIGSGDIWFAVFRLCVVIGLAVVWTWYFTASKRVKNTFIVP